MITLDEFINKLMNIRNKNPNVGKLPVEFNTFDEHYDQEEVQSSVECYFTDETFTFAVGVPESAYPEQCTKVLYQNLE